MAHVHCYEIRHKQSGAHANSIVSVAPRRGPEQRRDPGSQKEIRRSAPCRANLRSIKKINPILACGGEAESARKGRCIRPSLKSSAPASGFIFLIFLRHFEGAF